jgi:dolichol kinase
MDKKVKDWLQFKIMSIPFIMKWSWLIVTLISIIVGFFFLFTVVFQTVNAPTQDEMILSILERKYEDKQEIQERFEQVKESINNGDVTAQDVIDEYGYENPISDVNSFLIKIFMFFIGIPLGLRLITETSIVIFRINDNLQAIRDREE